MGIKFYLGLLLVVTLGLLLLSGFVKRIKAKRQLKYAFIYLVICMLICNFGYLTAIISETYYSHSSFVFAIPPFIAEIFIGVAFLFMGLIFAKGENHLTKNHLLLLVVPVISTVLLITNSYHLLFFKEYFNFSYIIYGPYFYYVHLPFTYGYIIAGLFLFISFSIKNAGFFSKQALIIVFGSILPLALNVFWVVGNALKIPALKLYSIYDMLPISFSVTIICFGIAIFKFDFLNIVPIALQRIVDLISDSYVVIDSEYGIIDYNRPFNETFGGIFSFKRKDDLITVLDTEEANIDINELLEKINLSVSGNRSVNYETQIIAKDFDKYFSIEITPIFTRDTIKVGSKKKQVVIGIIILLKDITEHRKNIKAIQESQTILVEQERLASLGQLIGGIAHNLKTPIMSLAGGIEAIKDLTEEYKESIGDKTVTDQDHIEIADEILSWLEKMKPYCAYMSDVISAVKGQAVQMNASTSDKFTIDELIKRVNLLMKHELKKYHCVLNIDARIDIYTELKGEVNNLVQVFDNIIINAIHSYEDKSGNIDLQIVRTGDNVEFVFRDYGKGIPEAIADKLFREMVTTKGKKGTGLGLYMSYSTIKGRFGGNMSFTSHEGEGTSFFITIPCINYSAREVQE